MIMLAVSSVGTPEGPAAAESRGKVDLSGRWLVTWTDGAHGPQQVEALFNSVAGDKGRYLTVPVPMELHRALQELGLLEDPNLGVNSLKARWVGEQYWHYHTTFDAPAEALSQPAWLVLEQLDLNATIALNGEILGTHKNAHIPCRLPVNGKLKPGLNTLGVSVESGLYDVADRQGAAYSNGLDALLNKRHWLRKPQYQFIWDWNPRLINVGITGPVRLEWANPMRMDQATVWALPSGDFSNAAITVRAFIEGLKDASPATLRVRIKETGQEVSQPFTVARGLHLQEARLQMEKPRLWWPRGHGEPYLYTAQIELLSGDRVVDSATRRFGVRTVEIDQSPHPVKGEHFTIKVNGRPVFCKGGNWVPPDMIYSSVKKERLRKLVDLAVAANFNLLRIWGGGTFAGHDLLDMCDQEGILVWHDLLYACARYPGDDPEFLAGVRQEVTWAVREFAHHPSLAVWCGNNEIEEGDWNWGYDRTGKSVPDYALYHHVIPVIMQQEDPLRPYWPSSPYANNHEPPNSPTTGDQHPWDVSLGNAGPNFWAYRQCVDRFPNEGGFLGASTPATLLQFLPEGQRALRSFSWEHHDNSVNFWSDDLGVTYKAVEYWLGKNYQVLGFDGYPFASALLQAEALIEYISNYRRRMFSSSAAIFWMYNDSWPVTHGWTIIDYYMRKKLAYHPVRRAFQPIAVVVADEGEKIGIFGINDTPQDWRGSLRFGLFRLAGGLPIDETKPAVLPANRSTLLAELSRSEWEKLGFQSHGAFALLAHGNETVAQSRLLLARFKDLTFAKQEVKVSRQGGKVYLTSHAFVWGAAIDLAGERDIPDNCFDVLPGIPYALPWPEDQELPRVLRTGNDLMSAAH